MRVRTATVLLPALVLMCVLSSGCMAPRINLWPVYFQETHPSEDDPEQLVTSVEILYPFFGFQRHAGHNYHVVRPLYNYESDQEKGWHRLQYLWPLGTQVNWEGASWLHRFYPLFQHSRTHRFFSGEKTYHGWLLPLFFWGRPPERKFYFGFFPVAGVTHRIFGDTFSWFAFPLYSLPI